MSKVIIISGRNVLFDDGFIKPDGCLKISSSGYVELSTYIDRTRGYSRYKRVLLHRIITNAPSGMVVDHIDGDILNNQTTNLRVCTRSDNCKNYPALGGRFNKKQNRWIAQIKVNGRKVHIGSFKNKEDAVSARNEYAASVSPFYRMAK